MLVIRSDAHTAHHCLELDGAELIASWESPSRADHVDAAVDAAGFDVEGPDARPTDGRPHPRSGLCRLPRNGVGSVARRGQRGAFGHGVRLAGSALPRRPAPKPGGPARLLLVRGRLFDRRRHVGRGRRQRGDLSDGNRPGARRRARGLRPMPSARPSRDEGPVRRLLLPEQRGDRRPTATRRRNVPSRGARRRLPPRQRNPGHLLRTSRRQRLQHPRRPGRGVPYFLGHADEDGAGPGEGYNKNLPLPRGTGAERWLQALDEASAWVAERSPEALVVSLGLDTFVDDPISHFTLQRPDFATLGRRLADFGLPTVLVMEGGYATAELGHNMVEVLASFDGA